MSVNLRFEQAISAFDSANAQDPNLEKVDGEKVLMNGSMPSVLLLGS